VSNASATVENFLNHLDGVRRSGDGWVSRCPCRDDDASPTLSISEGRDGRVLAKCHRGGNSCDLDEICASVGLSMRDLHPNHDTPQKGPNGFVDGELTNTYSYYDAEGELVFQVLRFAMAGGRKEFRQRVPDPSAANGWTYSTSKLSEKPLFHLPEVLEAVAEDRVVFVVEGEKDVETLTDLGFVATCNPQGADNGQGSKWKPNHSAALSGARVVIIRDNDEPGRIHADYVAAQLVARGSTVKIKRAPDPHKDVTDLVLAGGVMGELIEEEVLEPDPLAKLALLADSQAPLEQRLADASELLSLAAATSGLTVPATEQLVLPEAPKIGRLVNWADFIGETKADPYDWLIPDLLERQERVVIVAAEGVGKTTLARQVAILAGAGIHPFTTEAIEPVRTLFVDLENPERIIRRQARRILDLIHVSWGFDTKVHAELFIKPDGLNLLDQHDRDLLERQIEATEPQLICLGPVYKAYIDPGTKTSTALITELCTYFDYLRAVYGVTLWLEHHAPLGNALTGRDLRPADSAVWMRWPEFGFGIGRDPTIISERQYEWKPFRGSRDERRFPLRMRRGGLLPFEVISYMNDDEEGEVA
jgi:hypothetical protein